MRETRPGEHPARTGLDEHPRAGLVHGLDLPANLTGRATCAASGARIAAGSAGYGAAVVFE